MNAKTENKPIFPDGARVWISTNGYSKAVEADDVVIDGTNITIGGIVWNGSAWDFSNAGQSGGGGSGGGVLVVNLAYDEEKGNDYTDKTWKEINDAPMAVLVQEISLPGETIKHYRLVSEVRHNDSGEYSVYCYDFVANPSTGEVTVQEVKLVTDSENGYLTYAE